MLATVPQLPNRDQRAYEVLAPNYGLFRGRSPLEIPDQGLADCLNVRIRNRKITNQGIGSEKLFATSLGDHVLLIDRFVLSSGVAITVFGTKQDLFVYDTGSNLPLYLTPRYETGTVAWANPSTTLTGTGTSWTTSGIKAGDQIYLTATGYRTVDSNWHTVVSVDSDTTITLAAAPAGSSSGEDYTARLLFTATNSDYWDSDLFPDAPLGSTSALAAGDHWFATNNAELVVWDGSADQVIVLSTSTSGLGFSCKSLTYFKNMMLFLNIVESGASKPYSFKNSAIGDPENVTTLEANEFFFSDSVDVLQRIARLGDVVVGYGDNSINIAQFIGPPQIFAIQPVAPDIGIFAPRTLVNFGDYHEFLSKDQLYRFDGARLTPYGNHVFDAAFESINRGRRNKALAFQSKTEREVYWVVPQVVDGGDGTDETGSLYAYTEHYSEQAARGLTPFTYRYLPATAAGTFTTSAPVRFNDYTTEGFDDLVQRFNAGLFTSNFPIQLIGDANGYIYKLDTVNGFDGSALLDSSVTTPTRPIAEGESRGIIRRVEPFFEESETSGMVSVTTSTQERVDGTEDPRAQTFELDHSASRFLSFRNAGRYAFLRMESTDATSVWTLSGYKVRSETLSER